MKPFDTLTRAFSVENAFSFAAASELAYSSSLRVSKRCLDWGFSAPFFFDRKGTQGFIAIQGDAVVLAFRGTDGLADAKTDIKARKDRRPWLTGRAHRGFLGALEHVWPSIYAALSQAEESAAPMPLRIYVCGHSLGGALATLAAARLSRLCFAVTGCYVYGCPRVGNRAFARSLDRAYLPGKYFRVNNNNDIVTRLPPWLFGYRHAGERCHITDGGRLLRSPSWWRVFLDRVCGRLGDLGKPGTDGVKDHSSKGYMAALAALSGG